MVSVNYGDIILQQIERKNLRFWVRDGTSDEYIVKEVLGSEYNKLDVGESDVVVDIGSHIGVFACSMARLVKKVYTYEADPENFKLSLENFQLNMVNDKITPYNLAVVSDWQLTRKLYINDGNWKDGHTLLEVRGRPTIDVGTISIQNLIALHPTIIKMDIEGGEYECIKNIQTFGTTEQLIFEFHHKMLKDSETHEKYNEILKIVRKHFKTVIAKENPKKAWTSIIYCKSGKHG
jgi:FkbM family methyltransferase